MWELIMPGGRVLRDEAGEGEDGGGTPAPEGGSESGAPAAPPPKGLSLEILPEELRGRSEAEIKLILGNMTSTLKQQNQRARELEDRLRSMENQHKEPPKPAEPEKPLDELILEDPEKALDIWAKKRGYVDRFSSIESQVGETQLRVLRRELEDFNEVEDDVKEILRQSGAPMTEQNLLGAYTMVVGQRTLEERKRNQRERQNAEVPKPSGEPKAPKAPKLSPLEEQIRIGMGMTEEEYTKYKSDELEITVPVGGGKRA